MIKPLVVIVALCMFAGLLVACGGTPEPTAPPPTQTPWIVVVTATPAATEGVQVQPTQTPWIIVATATATQRIGPATTTPTDTDTAEGPTATSAATSEPPPPTDTPDAGEFKYPAPALLEPPNDRPVSWQSTVIFEWSSVGALGKDEYYHVHLERRPTTESEQWYGDYVYTKETSFLADTSFLSPFHPPADRGPATVYWWVRVVRKTGEDESGKPVGVDIGQNSVERTLVLEPKPD